MIGYVSLTTHEVIRTKEAAVAQLFQRHPYQWISALEIARIGGLLSWRTRISDCRRSYGMVIENRQRTVDGTRLSEFRYVPQGQRDLLEMQ